MKARKKVIWFHYNKPYSRKYGVDKWTVHWQGACHIVDQIHCYIPTFSKNRKTQPRVVMRGMASQVLLEDGIITIR